MKRKIAIIANGWYNKGLQDLYKGIYRYAEQRSIDVFMFLTYSQFRETNEYNKGEFNVYRLPDYRDFDGVIFVPGSLSSGEEAERIRKELVEANNKRMAVEAEVLKISEIERQRFSNDLHDDICQRLAGISMLCRVYTNQEDPIKKEQMEELTQLIGETLQCTRQYAHNSYPVELESLGMNHSLSNLCNSFAAQSGIKCEYFWDVPDDCEMDKLKKLNIFRIIQEALHNIMKHAKAQVVKVDVVYKNKKIDVSVSDNGCGFDMSKLQKSGLGLNSMQYRANQIGADFDITPNKPTGTCIHISVGV